MEAIKLFVNNWLSEANFSAFQWYNTKYKNGKLNKDNANSLFRNCKDTYVDVESKLIEYINLCQKISAKTKVGLSQKFLQFKAQNIFDS